jgi:hypothetical protein
MVRLPTLACLVSLLALTLVLVTPRMARAERELLVGFHESGHVVLDQLAGLQVGASGVGYAGPVGVSLRTETAEATTPGGPGSETTTTHLWFAPAGDVFVLEHLSLGGRVEIGHAWGAIERGGQRTELPGTTTFGLLPRVGFYVPIGDRLGIWPRVGLGWTSAEAVSFVSTGSTPTRVTFRSMLLDADLSLVYRFSETFFLRGGPEIGVTLGGRREEAGATSAGGGGSVLQIAGVVGFGVNLEL